MKIIELIPESNRAFYAEIDENLKATRDKEFSALTSAEQGLWFRAVMYSEQVNATDKDKFMSFLIESKKTDALCDWIEQLESEKPMQENISSALSTMINGILDCLRKSQRTTEISQAIERLEAISHSLYSASLRSIDTEIEQMERQQLFLELSATLGLYRYAERLLSEEFKNAEEISVRVVQLKHIERTGLGKLAENATQAFGSFNSAKEACVQFKESLWQEVQKTEKVAQINARYGWFCEQYERFLQSCAALTRKYSSIKKEAVSEIQEVLSEMVIKSHFVNTQQKIGSIETLQTIESHYAALEAAIEELKTLDKNVIFSDIITAVELYSAAKEGELLSENFETEVSKIYKQLHEVFEKKDSAFLKEEIILETFSTEAAASKACKSFRKKMEREIKRQTKIQVTGLQERKAIIDGMDETLTQCHKIVKKACESLKEEGYATLKLEEHIQQYEAEKNAIENIKPEIFLNLQKSSGPRNLDNIKTFSQAVVTADEAIRKVEGQYVKAKSRMKTAYAEADEHFNKLITAINQQIDSGIDIPLLESRKAKRAALKELRTRLLDGYKSLGKDERLNTRKITTKWMSEKTAPDSTSTYADVINTQRFWNKGDKKGRNIHRKNALPAVGDKTVANSYVLVKSIQSIESIETHELYYFKGDGRPAKVEIADMEKFLTVLEGKMGEQATTHLTDAEIKILITANGGYTHNQTKSAEFVIGTLLSETNEFQIIVKPN